jgi:hypothetical protein
MKESKMVEVDLMERPRMQALERANEVKSRRRELLRRIDAANPRDGVLVASEFIQNPPRLLRLETVGSVLRRVQGFGEVKIDGVCFAAEVDPSRTLASLKVRERLWLAAELEQRRAAMRPRRRAA